MLSQSHVPSGGGGGILSFSHILSALPSIHQPQQLSSLSQSQGHRNSTKQSKDREMARLSLNPSQNDSNILQQQAQSHNTSSVLAQPLQEDSIEHQQHNANSSSLHQAIHLQPIQHNQNYSTLPRSLTEKAATSAAQIKSNSMHEQTKRPQKIEEYTEILTEKITYWNALFLIILTITALLDSFVIFSDGNTLAQQTCSSQSTQNNCTTQSSQFYISCGLLACSPITLCFLVFQGSLVCQNRVISSQLKLSLLHVLTQCAYFEAIKTAFESNESVEVQSIWFRCLTFMIISIMFSNLIMRFNHARELSHLFIIAFITVRVLIKTMENNIFQLGVTAVPFLAMVHQFIQIKRLRHNAFMDSESNAKQVSIQKLRKYLRKQPSLLHHLPITQLQTPTHKLLHLDVNISGLPSPKSGINSNAFILGQHLSNNNNHNNSLPLQHHQSLGGHNSNNQSHVNLNQSNQSSLHLIQPISVNNQIIHFGIQQQSKQQQNSLSQSQLHSQRTLRETFTRDISLNALLPYSSNINSYTSITTTSQQIIEKQPRLQINSNTPPQSPIAQEQILDSHSMAFIGEGAPHLKQRLSDEQMTKISELDLEHEYSKQQQTHHASNASLYQQRKVKDKGSKHSQPSSSSQQFSQKSSPTKGEGMSSQQQELKSLIEQVIEVDGVVVFDAESENVVFANQNILALLETDSNHLLRELHQLKQVPVLDEKSVKENDFSISNLLKHIFKDSGNVNTSSPLIGPQNTTGKASSSKVGSVSLLNEVIEEEETEIEGNQKPVDNDVLNILKLGEQQSSLSKGTQQSQQYQHQQQQQQQQQQLQQQQQQQQAAKPMGCSLGSITIQQPSPSPHQGNGGTAILNKLSRPSSLHVNSSLPTTTTKKPVIVTTSKTPSARRAPSLLLNVGDSLIAVAVNDEEDDNYLSLRPTKKKMESIFKTLSPQFSASQHKIEGINRTHSNNSNSAISEIFNQTPNQEAASFTNSRQKRDTFEQLFPSFISSISMMQDNQKLDSDTAY